MNSTTRRKYSRAKIKTTVTNMVMKKGNVFKIANFEDFNEVVVMTSYKKESVRMSFPREISKYPMNHPSVVAAIKKATDTTVAALTKHLEECSGKFEIKTLDTEMEKS